MANQVTAAKVNTLPDPLHSQTHPYDTQLSDVPIKNLLKLSGQRALKWERAANDTLQRKLFLFIIHKVVTEDKQLPGWGYLSTVSRG